MSNDSKMKIYNIFPTTIFQSKSSTLDNEKIIKFLYEKKNEDESKNEEPIKRSNINGGYHSTFHIQRKKEMEELCNFIVDTINDNIVNYWYLGDNINKKNIHKMWGMINNKNHLNNAHNHPNTWLSGVYYLKVPKDSGDICFHDPVDSRSFSLDFSRLVRSREMCIKPEEGKLLLFPGWLYHSVTPNESDEDRMCVSFNIKRESIIEMIEESQVNKTLTDWRK